MCNTRNDFVINKPKKHFSTCYPYDYPLDPYVVFSSAGGQVGGYGLWVQQFGDGHSRFIQPVLMAAAF
jgi:hypothetical protein